MRASLTRLSESICTANFKNPRKAFECKEYNELLNNIFNKNELDHSYSIKGSIHYLEALIKSGFLKTKVKKVPIGLIKYESSNVGGRGLEIEVYKRECTSRVVKAARELEVLLDEAVLVQEQYLEPF